MKLFITTLLIAGHLTISAQQFSISPSIGMVKSVFSIKNDAPDLGNIKSSIPIITEFGLIGKYQLNAHSFSAGFRSLSSAYGYYIKPTNFTSLSAYQNNPLKQILFGYTYTNCKIKDIEETNENKKPVKYLLGCGFAINKVNLPEENLNNGFLPGEYLLVRLLEMTQRGY